MIRQDYNKINNTKEGYSERIVLCRPRGGLNDMLVQIERCHQYCRKYNRKLYIDGSRGGFLDDFSNYFIPSKGVSFKKIDFLHAPFDVFPKELNENIYEYEVQLKKKEIGGSNYVTEKGTPITFDFNRDYNEQILVHEQPGGGSTGYLALAKMQLVNEVRQHILEKIEAIKKLTAKDKYDAIHIRNTDYQTDYMSFFNIIKRKINKTTVLCTDDFQCQQDAKEYFGGKVITVTDIPDLSNAIREDGSAPHNRSFTLHQNKNLDRYKTNIDALTDVFILASSNNLYYTSVSKGTLSGFTFLAKSLNSNKAILKSLLGQHYIPMIFQWQLLYGKMKIEVIKVARFFRNKSTL